MKDNYFLYVGNAYPHKNVEVLILAADKAGVRVVFVGKEDYFYKRLGIDPRKVTDAELSLLYKGAQALVFPSLMEGFGLPALEALSYGCPVIASDIPVFHKLFSDVPRYFNPRDEHELVRCLLNPPLRTKSFQEKAAMIVKKYSWRQMAEKTQNVYETCTRL